MGCANLAALHTDKPVAEVLTVPLEPLWLNACYVYGEPDHDFYVSPEEEVLVMNYAGLWVGSQSRRVAGLVAGGVDFRVLH